MKPAQQLAYAASQFSKHLSAQSIQSTLRQPLILLSAPRAGSTLLYELLSKQEGYWNIGGESHILFASMPHLRFENSRLDSAALTEQHADEKTRILFRAELLYLAKNHKGTPFISLDKAQRPESITLLEKTPRNALNIPFLQRIFPHAKYVYLYREPRQNIASIMAGWKLGLDTGRFATYPQLPDWDRASWCFLLPRNWRSMRGKSLAEIAAFQWAQSNQEILDHLSQLPEHKSICLDYQTLIDRPADTLAKISNFAGNKHPANISNASPLPLSATTTSPPDANKWKAHEKEIEAQMPALKNLLKRIQGFT